MHLMETGIKAGKKETLSVHLLKKRLVEGNPRQQPKTPDQDAKPGGSTLI